MITKIDDWKIKHQPNIKIFLRPDNLIESKTKLIMKLNSQLTQYL
jgi:hypothetical protein